MSLVVTSSAALQDAEALPPTTTTVRGAVLMVGDTVDVPIGSANDITMLKTNVPVDARLHSVKMACDALGTSCTMDIGFYALNEDGVTFTTVAAAAIVSALDVHAAIARADYRNTVLAHTTANDPAWKLAGLSARPAYADLYIGLKFPAAVAAAGNVTVQVEHSSP